MGEIFVEYSEQGTNQNIGKGIWNRGDPRRNRWITRLWFSLGEIRQISVGEKVARSVTPAFGGVRKQGAPRERFNQRGTVGSQKTL